MTDQPVEHSLDDLLPWCGDAAPNELLGHFEDNADPEGDE